MWCEWNEEGKRVRSLFEARIGEARFYLEQLIKPSNPSGTKRVYYLGNFQKDVLDNFTEKQSKKYSQLWTSLKKMFICFKRNLTRLKMLDGVEWSGYEYIGIKK